MKRREIRGNQSGVAPAPALIGPRFPRISLRFIRATGLPRPMRLHVGPQQRIDLSLITLAPRSEPLEHINVQPQCNLLLGWGEDQSATDDRFREHFRRHLGVVRQVNILVAQRVDALPVSLGHL